MVIQSNMSPAAIVEVWEAAADVFKKHKIPLTKKTLETLVEEEQLNSLLQELNAAVGSSTATCIEGG
ncbi:hypothetical protein ACN6MT_29370 (plasmid) [Neobacillus niacini]|jgi:hypothetical protein|uniref:hypothetical protein n=1 Tax=Neobacillus niacini TaxID=86668 RepID=UPI003B027C56